MKRPFRIKRAGAEISILDAIADENLFAPFFRDPGTWSAWRAFLATLFGLPLTPGELDLFRQCTRRQTPSADGHKEAWLVIGRRGGKSFILALIAVYLACFREYRRRGRLSLIAPVGTGSRHPTRVLGGPLALRPLFTLPRDAVHPENPSVSFNVAGLSSWPFLNR
jgi:hypothetical protein